MLALRQERAEHAVVNLRGRAPVIVLLNLLLPLLLPALFQGQVQVKMKDLREVLGEVLAAAYFRVLQHVQHAHRLFWQRFAQALEEFFGIA